MLPAQYAWLANEPGPRMLREALALYGTKEVPGTGDNPEILSWARETGLAKVYSDDAIPWCGLFMAVVAMRADKPIPANPLWALNWLNFGKPVDRPMLGDTLVMERNGGGHVAIYVGEDSNAYHCIGGNQSDAVTFARIMKSRKPAFRRPLYVSQPANVRVIRLASLGTPISTKES